MENTIYTIGYTAFPLDEMLSRLRYLSIDCLVDVRSVPMSKHAPEFNRECLERTLRTQEIRYRNYPEFGARQPNRAYYTSEGWLDFDVYGHSESFQMTMRKIVDGLNAGYRFVLMCAEKDPISCHRAILIARQFSEAGYKVMHIRSSDGADIVLESQLDLERRLVQLNGDNLDQASLFETDRSRINRAYRNQNAKIGYQLEDEIL